MTDFRALHFETARENADASDWAETDAAKVLIARYLWLDDLYQTIACQVSTRVDEAMLDELNSVEVELDAIRDARVSDEIGNLSERDSEDDYLCEAIEDSAPSVTDTLKSARRIARDAAWEMAA